MKKERLEKQIDFILEADKEKKFPANTSERKRKT